MPLGTELVLLVDRVHGLELAGWHRAPAPYARGERVTSLDAAQAFATRLGFPAQGLLVMAMADGAPAPQHRLHCEGCGHDAEQPVRQPFADPCHCDHCNP